MCDQQGHFIGTLNMWGFNCVFSFSNGYSLEIKPENESAEMFQLKCRDLKGNFDDLGWIYGVSKWGKNVAFYPSKKQLLQLSTLISTEATRRKGLSPQRLKHLYDR